MAKSGSVGHALMPVLHSTCLVQVKLSVLEARDAVGAAKTWHGLELS
jgi:hypothetical protein